MLTHPLDQHNIQHFPGPSLELCSLKVIDDFVPQKVVLSPDGRAGRVHGAEISRLAVLGRWLTPEAAREQDEFVGSCGGGLRDGRLVVHDYTAVLVVFIDEVRTGYLFALVLELLCTEAFGGNCRCGEAQSVGIRLEIRASRSMEIRWVLDAQRAISFFSSHSILCSLGSNVIVQDFRAEPLALAPRGPVYVWAGGGVKRKVDRAAVG